MMNRELTELTAMGSDDAGNGCYPELGKCGFFPANPVVQTNSVTPSRCTTIHNRVTNVFDKFTIN